MKVMKPTVLLLGHTGKMGLALQDVLSVSYTVVGRNSRDFDAATDGDVARLLDGVKPAIVINAVAFMGIDACDAQPQKAFAVNALFPKALAAWSHRVGGTLVHLSTEAVFPDAVVGGSFVESNPPRPINVYGFTKYGGDCFVSAGTPRHYIFRLPMLFGESLKPCQFVEKMAVRIMAGEPEVQVSTDCCTTPSYSRDVAVAVRDILVAEKPLGLYHLANAGQASLFELITELVKILRRDVRVVPVSHTAFRCRGTKNLRPILASEKGVRLRPWQEALRAYMEPVRKGARVLYGD